MATEAVAVDAAMEALATELAEQMQHEEVATTGRVEVPVEERSGVGPGGGPPPAPQGPEPKPERSGDTISSRLR